MGRPRGSLNKKGSKKNGKGKTTTETTDVSQGADQTPSQEDLEALAKVVVGDAEEDPPVPVRDYNANPLTDEEIDTLADQLCDVIKSRDEKQAEVDEAAEAAAKTAKKYKTEIAKLDAKISDIATQRRRAYIREEYDYIERICRFVDRRTGLEVEPARPLGDSDLQEKLPFDGRPSKPPELVLSVGQRWRMKSGELLTITDNVDASFPGVKWDNKALKHDTCGRGLFAQATLIDDIAED